MWNYCNDLCNGIEYYNRRSYFISYVSFYNTVGKRCMKVDIIIPQKGKLKYSILHGVLKILTTILWPLCALIYFIMGFKMPYDKYIININ